MSVRNLESLFQPRSVALIGASDREGSLGRVVLRNLKAGGFSGPIRTVNARRSTVDGEACWPSVEALPEAPDLAVICTPAATVPALIAALGQRGTRAAIVLSAGLQQPVRAGGPSGTQAMLDAARPHLLRILGPNCLGALVPGAGLNASFAPGNARPGKLAFVTQSGALATAMLDWAQERGIGFSHFVSLGDSADVDFGDMLDYLASDEKTRAILLYIESVRFARKFMSAARAAARNKPVIVVKAGRAPEGARAAASHTGALAGSDAVFDAAIRRAGMLRVDTLEALFDAAETLARVRPMRGPRLAILTNGGGAGVLAADALALGGGTLAALDDATRAALDRCLPQNWSRGNPVDIIGDAPVARYVDALQVLLAAPEVDAVLFMHAPTAIVPAGDIAAACLPLLQQAGKPVLSCWLGGSSVAAARQRCAEAGVASYDTPERAVAAWLQLVSHADNQALLQQMPAASPEAGTEARDRAAPLLARALAEGRAWLDAEEARSVLEAYGIPTLPSRIAADATEAASIAEALGFPVALKIVSPQIVHKSDVGGVVLGLSSAHAVRKAVAQMAARIAARQPGAAIQGFQVQAMAARPQARELIVGLSDDPLFGPVLLFGEGGTTVELRQAHAIALPPLDAPLAQDLMRRSQCLPLLAAHRGRTAVDTAALVDTLCRVSRMACELAALAELDINPLLSDSQGVLALDARIRLRQPAPGEGSRLAILPYPQQLEASLQLGEDRLLLRPIRPEDGARLAAFYAHASPADMRLRFFMARREVPRSELARYSQIDYDREMTFIALPDGGAADSAMAGEVRGVCDPDNERAEFAMQVASAWQGRGLGTLLLGRMVDYLRARGTAEVVGECLLENHAMAAVARRAGFTLAVHADEGIVRMRRVLRDGPVAAPPQSSILADQPSSPPLSTAGAAQAPASTPAGGATAPGD